MNNLNCKQPRKKTISFNKIDFIICFAHLTCIILDLLTLSSNVFLSCKILLLEKRVSLISSQNTAKNQPPSKLMSWLQTVSVIQTTDVDFYGKRYLLRQWTSWHTNLDCIQYITLYVLIRFFFHTKIRNG